MWTSRWPNKNGEQNKRMNRGVWMYRMCCSCSPGYMCLMGAQVNEGSALRFGTGPDLSLLEPENGSEPDAWLRRQLNWSVIRSIDNYA